MRFKNINLASLIEMLFAVGESPTKFSYKLVDKFEKKEMICYFQLENDDLFELTVEIEDQEYLNVLLVKHISSKPYELCFVNYLTNISELITTLTYINNIYIKNGN
jgi:hypothetical protein